MLRAFLVCVLIAIALPAFGLGKVTTDPNLPGAAAKPDQDMETDSRLARTVTISVSGKPVKAILAELTRSTGVMLKAGYNVKDWQVRDRGMNVFARDVPLAALMNSIARVMKFKWARAGDAGKWTYRLFMDRKTLLDAEAQRVRAEAKAEAEQAKRRANALAEYAKLSDLSDADMAKLKTENPLFYVIAQAGMGGAVGSFFREIPAAAEAIAFGRRLDMDMSMLSPSAQAAVLAAWKSELDIEDRFRFSGGSAIPEDLDISKVRIRVNENLESTKGQPEASFLVGEVIFYYADNRQVGVPVFNPASEAGKSVGKLLLQVEAENRPAQEVLNEYEKEFEAVMTTEAKAQAGGEPLNEHPDDPALKDEVTLKPSSRDLPDVEEALAEASKLAVVSDFFSGQTALGSVPTAKAKLKAVLESIGEAYVYNWDKRGPVIELRDRNWFRKRAIQVPDEWIEKWRRELTTSGTVEIDTMAQIAQLTYEQITANVEEDDVLRRSDLAGRVTASRDILRFYAVLDSAQRAMLFAETGLDLALLSPDQWTQASKLIQAKHGPDALKSGKPIAMVCERRPIGKGSTNCFYGFSLIIDGQDCGTDWQLGTPLYQPPPAEEPEPGQPAGPAK